MVALQYRSPHICHHCSGSGVSATTSSRGSIGETSRHSCAHGDCCSAHADEQEPAELKKIKKVRIPNSSDDDS